MVLVFTSTRKAKQDMACGKVERGRSGLVKMIIKRNCQNYNQKKLEQQTLDVFVFDSKSIYEANLEDHLDIIQ